jgi:chromosome segregation ATPase
MENQQLHDRLDEFFRILTVTAKGVRSIESDVSEIKSDVSVLKSDVAELKSDVSVLKSDVAELKSDVSVLKSDVAELKSDVLVLKQNDKILGDKLDILSGQFNDVAMMVFKNDGRLTQVELDVAELKSNIH